MKHHLLRLMALFLLAVPVVQAQMQEKKIIVSSLGTPEKAERALEQLQKYLENYPDIASLLDENGIALHSRPSGKYFIVVIEPFTNKSNLSKVKNTLKQRYPGLFVNNYVPETDVIVTESTGSPKVTIQEEVAMDMVVEEVPESLMIIKDSEDAAPRVVVADKVEVPKVIAIDKKTLEAEEKEIPTTTTTSTQDNVSKASDTVTVIEEKVDNTAATVSEAVDSAKKVLETPVEKAPEVVAAVKESIEKPEVVATVEETIEKSVQKTPVATEVAATPPSKEKFINHHPEHKTQTHDSIFPPWWVLLSILVLILSPISSYIENRNNKRYR